MAIYKSISELVGNTPLVQINKSNNSNKKHQLYRLMFFYTILQIKFTDK